MINGLKVEANDKTLAIDWKASSDDVLKFAAKACEFIKQHHGEWHHGQSAGKPWEKSDKKPTK